MFNMFIQEGHFIVELNEIMAWVIRDRVRPGPHTPHDYMQPPQAFYTLREKVNKAITLFTIEPSLEVVPLELDPEEGWALDKVLNYDSMPGEPGLGTALLCQIFRGMEAVKTDIPQGIVGWLDGKDYPDWEK